MRHQVEWVLRRFENKNAIKTFQLQWRFLKHLSHMREVHTKTPDTSRRGVKFACFYSFDVLLRVCWGVVEVLLRCYWGVVEVLSRCCWGIVEMSLRCCWGVVEVLLRCCWGVVEVLRCWGVVEVLLRCCWGVVEVLLKSCWGVVEVLLKCLGVDMLLRCWDVEVLRCWGVVEVIRSLTVIKFLLLWKFDRFVAGMSEDWKRTEEKRKKVGHYILSLKSLSSCMRHHVVWVLRRFKFENAVET